MAIVLRALELAVDDAERTPRSATMHFLRVPEVGPVTVRATIERAGRSLTTVSGRLEQDGQAARHRPRGLLEALAGAAARRHRRCPRSSRPRRAPPQPAELPRRDPPAFTQRLTMQHRFGEPPFSGAEHGEIGGWLGLLEERPLDALAIAVLRRRLVPGTVAAARSARAGADDRPLGPLPHRPPAARLAAARPLHQRPGSRRVLRRGRAALDARRHARRPVAPARAADRRELARPSGGCARGREANGPDLSARPGAPES